MITYQSLADLIALAEQEGHLISDLIFAEQAKAMEVSSEELYHNMEINYQVMANSIKQGLVKDIKSTSGLSGGDAYLLNQQLNSSLCGGLIPKAISYALAVAEYNAAMGKIVASPTAGSCGVLPGVLFALKEQNNYSDKQAIMAMFSAGAIGMIIANKASISGAEGGCQAEIGSAAAMAAGLAVELAGGSPQMIGQAVAIALNNMMGLVCDPVAGLVEIPCIYRNAAGAANALTAAEMALAGLKSIIPVDEVILTMKRVGDALHPSLKETAQGGLAQTPTGKLLFKQVFGNQA